MRKAFSALFLVAILFTAVDAGAAGTLDKIKKSGVIVIGHRVSSVPFSHVGADGKPMGYSVDLCLRIAEAVEDRLGMKGLKIDFVPVNPQNRMERVADGTVDLVCGSSTHTLGRRAKVDFTLTTFVAGTKLLVRKNSGIGEIEDLNGKTVALTKGTTNVGIVKSVVTQQGLSIRVLLVKDHGDGFKALESGRADAYATDDILLYGLAAKAPSPGDYAVVGRFLSFDPYAIMLRRNDSAFRLVADQTLAGLFRSGEIKDIYRNWFGISMNRMLETQVFLQAFPE